MPRAGADTWVPPGAVRGYPDARPVVASVLLEKVSVEGGVAPARYQIGGCPWTQRHSARSSAASATGVVTISGLPPGEYLVATATENTTGWMTREVLEKISGVAERFRLSESEKLVVVVRR